MKPSMNKSKFYLLSTVCASAITMAGAAAAQESSVDKTDTSIIVNQANNAFGLTPPSIDIDAVVGGNIFFPEDGDPVAPISSSTIQVGGPDDTDRNLVSALSIANESSATLSSTQNLDLIGAGPANLEADTFYSGRQRAQTDTSAGGLTINVTQQNDEVSGSASLGNVDIFETDSNGDLVLDIDGNPDVAETIDGTSIGIAATSVTDSDLSVLRNIQEAVASFNQSTATLNADANITNMSAGIVSSQANTGSIDPISLAATADATATIDVDTGNVTQSQLTLEGNLQRAAGVANFADNSISADGNQVDVISVPYNETAALNTTTAGIEDVFFPVTGPFADAAAGFAIANTQTTVSRDARTLLNATVGPEAKNGFNVSVGGAVTDSQLVNDANSASASITGNAANNSVTLDATDIETVEFDDDGEVVTATANTVPDLDQTLFNTADLELQAALIAAGFERPDPNADNFVIDTAALNTFDELIVNADGKSFALSQNAGNLDIQALDTQAAIGTIASVANSQMFDADATASAFAADIEAARTTVGDNLTSSEVSTSGNQITARGVANTAANTVDVDAASSLDTTGDDSSVATSGLDATNPAFTLAESTAAITLSSSQSASGSVTATLSELDGSGNPVSGASIGTTIGGDVQSSEVMSNNNLLSATAIGNEIVPQSNEIVPQTNEISVTGNEIATTTAATNLQQLDADISAVIGSPGQPESLGETIPEQTFTNNGSTGTVDLSAEGFDQATLDDYVQFLRDNAAFNGASESNGIIIVNFVDQSATTPNITIGSQTFGASPAVPASGGVIASVGEGSDILDSTVSVDGNEVAGAVTGNVATNRVEIDGNSISEGGDAESANAGTTTPFGSPVARGTVKASADHSLTNAQFIELNDANDAPDLATSVSSAFAIIQDGDETTIGDVAHSELSVSGNRQFAEAEGNVADNTLSLDAGTMETTGALLSVQESVAAVSAVSSMEVYAPAATLSSTLDMSSNRNQALSTINDASNEVMVSGTNISSVTGGVDATLQNTLNTTHGLVQAAEADFILNNYQTAATTSAATVNTQINNLDGGRQATAFETSGVRQSSITVDRNVSFAEARANRAENTLTLDAGSTFGGTAGVLNSQQSSANVQANAVTDADLTVSVETGLIAALNQSTMSMSGNATTVRAQGNSALNSLNAEALRMNATDGTGASSFSDTGNATAGTEIVTASFTVLNGQINAGNVRAIASTSYSASFSGNDAPSISGSSVRMNGNIVQGSAVGNTATNVLQVSALNYGASSAAMSNEQLNTGNVTSNVSANVSTSASVGSVQSSRVGMSGNSVTSSAVGNRAVSSISRN